MKTKQKKKTKTRERRTRPPVRTAADLLDRSNPENPRVITEEQLAMLAASMREFGDLSGLVLNESTGNLVGGHQRVKLLADAPVTLTKRYAEPTAVGTVAEGFVSVENGERFGYRVVRWNQERERAAMIAANKHGGEWDDFRLRELLATLRDGGEIDMELTGFSADELTTLLKSAEPPPNFQPLDENLPIQHKCPKCGYQWSGKPA